MNIEYADTTVKKYFTDFNFMQRKKGHDLARIVKKRCDQLRAAENFNRYLSFGLGKPHLLRGDLKGCYGIHITGNIRLIVVPVSEGLDSQSLLECSTVIIKGVMDYHGEKYEWIIP